MLKERYIRNTSACMYLYTYAFCFFYHTACIACNAV